MPGRFRTAGRCGSIWTATGTGCTQEWATTCGSRPAANVTGGHLAALRAFLTGDGTSFDRIIAVLDDDSSWYAYCAGQPGTVPSGTCSRGRGRGVSFFQGLEHPRLCVIDLNVSCSTQACARSRGNEGHAGGLPFSGPVTVTIRIGTQMAVGKLFHIIHMTGRLNELEAWYDDVFAVKVFMPHSYMPGERRDASLVLLGDTVIEPLAPAFSEPDWPQFPLGRFYSRFGDHWHSIAYYADDTVDIWRTTQQLGLRTYRSEEHTSELQSQS